MTRGRAALALVVVVSAAGSVVVSGGGCATFDDRLREGRVYDACRAQYDDIENAQKLRDWVAAHTHSHAQIVSHDVVAEAMGGSITGYGTDIGVYEVGVDVDSAAHVELVGFSSSALDLVLRLAPLVVEKGFVAPPGPVGYLGPTSPPSSSSSRGGGSFLGDMFGAFFGVGEAIGAAVVAPMGILAGVFIGGMTTLFGPGTSSSSSTPEPSALERAANAIVVQEVAVPAASSDDALLESPEWTALSEARGAEAAARRTAAEAERDRRRALLLSGRPPASLTCRPGACRITTAPGTRRVWVLATFASGGDSCTVSVEVDVVLAATELNPAATTTASAKAPLPRAVSALDEGAPPWVKSTGATTSDLRSARKSTTTSTDLACFIETKANAKDDDGTAPDLAVRVTVGRATPRAESFYLGDDVKKAFFIAPGVQLAPGERLRMTAYSGARNLGAAIVDDDGALPLKLKAETFTATCTEPDATLLEAARTKATDDAGRALDALSDAVKGADANEIVTNRKKTRATLAALAMLDGWSAPAVTTSLARLRALDPAEQLPKTP